jgi:hypothetical protein
MKKIILTLLVVSALFSACKKDSNNQPKPVAETYQPLTAGSTWKYLSTSDGERDTATNTLTGETKIINNKTYYTVTSVSTGEAPEKVYFNVDNKVYSIIQTDAETGEQLELQYLKEDAAIGSSWTSPIPGSSLPAQMVGNVVEKGINKTINSKTYSNVIHTRLLVQVDSGQGFETFMTYNFYVAKGIGLIGIYGDLGGNPIVNTELLSYNIK